MNRTRIRRLLAACLVMTSAPALALNAGERASTLKDPSANWNNTIARRLVLPDVDQGSGGDVSGFSVKSYGESVARTLADLMRLVRMRSGRSQYDFGARCDGVSDDYVPLRDWLAAGQYEKLVFAEGTCLTSKPLRANYDYPRIYGAGMNRSILVYAGSYDASLNPNPTTTDILTFGDGTNIRKGIDLEGFRIRSNTVMSDGAGLRIRRFQNAANRVVNVSFGTELNNERNLNHGIWFDNVNVITYKGFDINVANEGLRVNGSAALAEGSDLGVDDGVIVGGKVGLHIGGDFGGFYSGYLLIIGAETDALIDTAIVNRQNREIFFSSNTVFDQNKNYGLYINDPLAGGSSINIEAFIGSAGRKAAGGVGENIHIESWPNSYVIFGSTRIFNSLSHNIVVNDPTANLVFSSKTVVSDSPGYGITGSQPTTRVFGDPLMTNNLAGNKGPNIRNPLWSAFPSGPGIVSETGAFASIARNAIEYKVVGGVCFAQYDFSILDKGTGGGAVILNLPAPARSPALFSGREIGVSNRAISGSALPGQNLYAYASDGTSFIQNGARVVLDGFYNCQ